MRNLHVGIPWQVLRRTTEWKGVGRARVLQGGVSKLFSRAVASRLSTICKLRVASGKGASEPLSLEGVHNQRDNRVEQHDAKDYKVASRWAPMMDIRDEHP